MVGVVVLVAIVVSILFLLLNWYVAPNKPNDRKDLVLALAQILGGAALLSGIYFTWRTLQVNREWQITDRFTRAIDQLGNEELEIRLGGIYALERIARDSERDHWPIMEVLTAYVRRHAPRQPAEGQGGETHVSIRKDDGVTIPSRAMSRVNEVFTEAADIQAIMTILVRRTRSIDHGEPDSLHLGATDLAGVNLAGVNFQEANLSGANLSGARLSRANLEKASLEKANLYEADLYEANLWGANLRHADLRHAHLQRAELGKANFYRANLSQTAHLYEANFYEANLFGANLEGAALDGANLSGANLSGANLSGAHLEGAALTGADLDGANLSGAHLEQKQLEGTRGDYTTRLPPTLKPPAHWGDDARPRWG